MADQKQDRTEAFIRLLSEHERRLGTYAMMMIPHAQDCDEVLQEAKLVMWRSFDRFQLGTDFLAWSRKVVFHQVLKYRRRPSRRLQPFADEILELLASDIDSDPFEFDRREEALMTCIEKLSSDHREIVRLRYRDELSIDRISDRSGRTSGAVYRVLSRIRRSLHECVSAQVKMGEQA